MGRIQRERLPKSKMASSDDRFTFEIVHVLRFELACVAGVRRGRKEERRVREARKDRTQEIAVGDACKDALVFFIPPSN